MSEALLVRRGGGGVGKLFAAIGVSYPAGSTCTCSDGTKTFTAKDTSGQWIFPIPYAGTWTVTATDGTDTATETVEITTQGQSVNVELSYRLYLVKNRIALVGFTPAGSATVTNNTVKLTGGEEAASLGGVGTTAKVNIAGWKTLRGQISLTPMYADYGVKIGLDNRDYINGDTVEWPLVASHHLTPATAFNELSVDLTSVAAGSYTVSAFVKFNLNAYLENLWLE